MRQFPAPSNRVDLDSYEMFLLAAGRQLCELAPLAGEDVQELSSCLDEAAERLGVRVRSWIDDGRVYFYILPAQGGRG